MYWDQAALDQPNARADDDSAGNQVLVHDQAPAIVHVQVDSPGALGGLRRSGCRSRRAGHRRGR